MNIFAYLDPGTGSLVVQVILGGALAVGVALKAYWGKITGLFKKKSSDTKADQTKSSE